MTPEQQARQEIDEQLAQCGWLVQNAPEMNISAGLGVAIREFPLKTGQVDYLLYADRKAIGVIEAKPGLEHIKGLTQLLALYLNDTQVTDEGVKKLQQALPNCVIGH